MPEPPTRSRTNVLGFRRNWRTRLNGIIRTVWPKQRRFHLYCVGTTKSGTHSMAGVFGRFRTMHEPSATTLNHLAVQRASGGASDAALRNWFRWRDRSMQLEVESNCFLLPFVDVVAPLFAPDARFIVTYRHPRSWLASWINHTIDRREVTGSIWDQALEATYRPERYEFSTEKSVFSEHRLYPLDSYLSFWSDSNVTLLRSIPPERSLFIETSRIGESLPRIAAFLGFDVDMLDHDRSHLFQRKRHHEVLEKLDQDFLSERIQKRCGAVLTELNRRADEPIRTG